jgi:hypothetical protein
LDKLSSLIGGFVLLLIALEGLSITLTGKARVFRWIGQQAKKAITAIWRWFWRTAWRGIRYLARLVWRGVRAFFRWLFGQRQQPQGGNP